MTAILSPEVYPFTVSAGVMLGLVLAEGMSLFVGASVSGLVDHALHLDQGSDADADGPGMGVLNWFNLGGIPFLALVILFTASFAIFGYAIQGLAGLAGGPLPTWAASAVALAGAVPATRRASRTVGRLVPRDESYAVGLADFVGRTGKVMVGPLDQGLPGSISCADAHGNRHTLRAVAAEGQPPIEHGEPVLVVDRAGHVFTVVPAPAELRA
jgi:membrane protein implicated in regulation of membrane protease activity